MVHGITEMVRFILGQIIIIKVKHINLLWLSVITQPLVIGYLKINGLKPQQKNHCGVRHSFTGIQNKQK